MTRTELSPRSMDAVLALIAFVVAMAVLFGQTLEASDRSPDVWAVAILAIAPLALAVARSPRSFALAVVATVGASLAYLFADYPFAAVYPALLLALYLIAARSRPHALATGVAAAIVAMLAVFFFSDDPVLSFETLADAALVLLPVVVGDNVRVRRVATQALIERAEAAERTRDQVAAERVQQERLRIARDLHDVLTHTISTLNVQAGVAAHVHSAELPAPVNDVLVNLRDTSHQALDEVRSLLHLLRSNESSGAHESALPARLQPVSTLADVPGLVEQFADDGMQFSSLSYDHDDVPGSVAVVAYQTVREALANCDRHAPGQPVELAVTSNGSGLQVEVRNPLGDPQQSTGSRVGLIGMRERVEALGGTLTAAPVDGSFVVRASLPVRN